MRLIVIAIFTLFLKSAYAESVDLLRMQAPSVSLQSSKPDKTKPFSPERQCSCAKSDGSAPPRTYYDYKACSPNIYKCKGSDSVTYTTAICEGNSPETCKLVEKTETRSCTDQTNASYSCEKSQIYILNSKSCEFYIPKESKNGGGYCRTKEYDSSKSPTLKCEQSTELYRKGEEGFRIEDECTGYYDICYGTCNIRKRVPHPTKPYCIDVGPATPGANGAPAQCQCMFHKPWKR